MVPQGRLVTLAALVLMAPALAGCLEPPEHPLNEAQSTSSSESRSTARGDAHVELRTLTLFASVPEADLTETDRTTPIGAVEIGPRVVDATVDFSWLERTHRWNLVVTSPTGETFTLPAGGAFTVERHADLRDEGMELAAGVWSFEAEPAVYPPSLFSDELTIQFRVGLMVAPGDAVVAEGGSVEATDVERDGSGFIARRTVTASGPLGSRAAADIDVANGPVTLVGKGDAASLVLVAYARGATEQEARDRLADIQTDVRVATDTLVAKAWLPGGSQTGDWSNRGASVAAIVPVSTTLTGQADTSNGPLEIAGVALEDFVGDTSNGPINLDDVAAKDVSLDTSNGGIKGYVRTAGTFAADTSNGPVDLVIEPVARTELAIDTSNGPVTLGLSESSKTSYDLTASTSNGRITSDMDDARYEGDKRNGRLQTGGSPRAHHVTGDVDTSNADIRFQGR